MAVIGSKRIAEFLTGEYSADIFIKTEIHNREWITMVLDKLGFTIEHEIDNSGSLPKNEIVTKKEEARHPVEGSFFNLDSSKGA